MRYLYFTITIILSSTVFAFDHNHTQWSNTLNKFLKIQGSQTLFKYKELINDRSEFDSYIQNITSVKKSEYDSFNRDQRLSFLINSYNALTVKFIADNYPVKSIKDLGSLFRSPWKKKFFKFFGKKTHLDNIEHDMIREWFAEPRIHFAVVCASLGCPPLATKAFTEDNLEVLLEKQALNFLKDTQENELRNGKLYLSKIFKWYGDDFNDHYGGYKKFVAPRISKDEKIQKLIINGDIPSIWNDYNWQLNE